MVRVRIAPSPTGIPHIGNTRTALFNWLFAKHNKGKFILRVEDTDRERLVPGSIEAIYEILDWLGLKCDEGPKTGGTLGPYIQSQRLPHYQKNAQKLVDDGNAYYCFCSNERLQELRKRLEIDKKPPKYDRLCFALKPAEIKSRIIKGEPHVVRILVPNKGRTTWNDLVHGPISFDNSLLDDSVILKSDGFPTYHLAVVVDDFLMKISHVLRGDEWISSTPKHLLLYQFLKLTPPQFGHFPLILGSDKSKLSKRHGAMSVLDYRNQGYLPEALINFMVLLGWSPSPIRSLGEGGKKEKELFGLKELIDSFSIEHINKNSPVFNKTKLDWFNSQWIRRIPADDLLTRLKGFIPPDWDVKTIMKILPLVVERITTLKDFKDWTDFFFEEPKIDPRIFKTLPDSKKTKHFLSELLNSYQKLTAWHKDDLEKITKIKTEELGLDKNGSFMIVRVAITGKTVGPPLFESLEILGRNASIRRLKNAASNKKPAGKN